MTKVLFPVLVIIGLVVGLLLVIGRSRVPLVRGRRGLVAVILAVAAAVAGTQCAGSSGRKGADGAGPGLKMSTVEGPLQHVEKRIGVLEKLHAQGKLTDAVYRETLALLEDDLSLMEKSKLHAAPMGEAEKKLADMCRQMDEALIERLGEEDAWKTLEDQVKKLRVVLDGGEREFEGEEVEQAVQELRGGGFIDQTTAMALSTCLTEVYAHYERLNPIGYSATCYAFNPFGFEMKQRRVELTEMVAVLEEGGPSGEEYESLLGVLARSVACYSTEDKEVCQAEPGLHDRLIVVTALDLLIALYR